MAHELDMVAAPPAWATGLLACPRCHAPLRFAPPVLCCGDCGEVGHWEDGIACFDVPDNDPSIAWYQSVGGTRFHERTQIPQTMSSLDTPIYHSYLAGVRPDCRKSVIVDLGAGDGRNTLPWLSWGYERIVAVDAVAASLARFRAHLSEEHPEWLEHVLLVQADVRRLPLISGGVARAIAIETLYYLNEDYAAGLAECRRVLDSGGLLLTAERSWEGALLTHLLYGGVEALCQLAESRDVWDGEPGHRVRSRSFTEDELCAELARAGFAVLARKGVSVLSVVLGYLRGQGAITAANETYLPQVRQCLQMLAEQGAMRKAHVVTARPVTGDR
jgi:SAM-dependent methyltransferase